MVEFQKNSNGFTLIEMSIVLVIIGLITGAIFAGSSLIELSKVQSVATDFRKIQTSLNIYQDKYGYLPGDHPNAYSYFDNTGGSSICGQNNNTNSGCNGNGDGKFSRGTGMANEYLRSWVHLNLSNILPNSLTGALSGGAFVPGDNVYESRIKSAGFNLILGSGVSGGSVAFGRGPGNAIQFGRTAGTSLRAPVLTPAQARSIDSKIDDGTSSSGKLMGLRTGGGSFNALGSCSDNPALFFDYQGAYASADYLLSNTNKSCYLIFWLN